MKKLSIILTLALVATLSLSVNAQRNKAIRSPQTIMDYSEWNIGVKGGILFNDQIWSNLHVPSHKFHMGPIGGLVIEYCPNFHDYPLGGHFTVGLEALFAVRGTNMTYDHEFLTSYTQIGVSKNEYHSTLNCLEGRIPFTFYFSTQENLKPYVVLAPTFTYVMGGTINWMKSYTTWPVGNEDLAETKNVYQESCDVGEANMRRIDVGIQAGAGIWWRYLTRHYYFIFKLEAAYNYGFMDSFSPQEKLQDDGTVEVQQQLGLGDLTYDPVGTRHNQSFEVTASVLFPIKKALKGACRRWGDYD
jgi:hypothetical protein